MPVSPALQGQGGLDKLIALEDADFILSFKSHFNKRRGKYYRIIDEYTLGGMGKHSRL